MSFSTQSLAQLLLRRLPGRGHPAQCLESGLRHFHVSLAPVTAGPASDPSGFLHGLQGSAQRGAVHRQLFAERALRQGSGE